MIVRLVKLLWKLVILVKKLSETVLFITFHIHLTKNRITITAIYL